MGDVEIVRWPVETLAMKDPAGSNLRRSLLTRGVRLAVAANNRRDYDTMLVSYHPNAPM